MACSRSFIEPQYTLYRFSIYSRILLVCSNDNSNKNCCNCVIILLLFNNLGNIANCAQQESRTPVQPSRPRPFRHQRMLMPFSSTVIISTSIASVGSSLVTVIFSLPSCLVSVTVFGFVSLYMQYVCS